MPVAIRVFSSQFCGSITLTLASSELSTKIGDDPAEAAEEIDGAAAGKAADAAVVVMGAPADAAFGAAATASIRKYATNTQEKTRAANKKTAERPVGTAGERK